MIHRSPKRRKKDDKRLRAQERHWANKSGRVTTYHLCVCPNPCKSDEHIERNLKARPE